MSPRSPLISVADLGAELAALIRTGHHLLILDGHRLTQVSSVCVGVLNRAANDLLALGTLHLLSGDAKGPSYAQAISGAVEQGAARPTWNGGRMRLTVPVSVAFPEPCCYELRLEAWKRIIVGGGGGSPERRPRARALRPPT